MSNIIIALVIIVAVYALWNKINFPDVTKTLDVRSTIEEQTAPKQEIEQEIKQETGVREINVTSGNLFFQPGAITLKKGQPARIMFQNTGYHTFTVDELGVNTTLQGSSAVGEFTPDKIGTFRLYCAVPGHAEGGMVGTITVTE